MHTLIRSLTLLAITFTLLHNAAFAQRIGFGPAVAPAPTPWNECEYVLVGKLDEALAGPVAKSFPPIYNHTLKVTVAAVYRGTQQAGDVITAHHAARQANAPTFPVGNQIVIGLKKSSHEGMTAIRLEEADDKQLAAIKRDCQLPLGWKIDGQQLLSPWHLLADKAWPKQHPLTTELKCSATNRPALLCGPGLTFTVEPVPPAEKKQYQNPDGDGEYTLTIKNTTDKDVTIPALLSDGEEILWEESVVILCQKQVYPLPTAKGVPATATATKLPAGKSVSTTFHTFKLTGPEWPRGGYRIEFQFCLGELSQTKSFYYYSKHHDPIRDAQQAK
jgi:hypothetical protein